MTKLFSLLVVSLFLTGSAAALTQPSPIHSTFGQTITETHLFSAMSSSPSSDSAGFISVGLTGAPDLLMNPGQPVIPRLQRTYELPLGVKNICVGVQTAGLHEQTLDRKIAPAPSPKPKADVTGMIHNPGIDLTIYTSDAPYPEAWFSTQIGVGLGSQGARVTYLTVNLFPLRYYPASNRVQQADQMSLTITYDQPQTPPKATGEDFDLVIITPAVFEDEVQRLVDHKNSFGMHTYLMTLESIYSQYQGVDKPEQIKYFLKDAIETHNITYAMLIGGLKNSIWGRPRDTTNYGAKGWYFPVRFSNFMYDGAESYNYTSDEPSYLCDLYFADVYKYDNESGYTFDDWDSNGNGIYAEWSGTTAFDQLDLYPDLAVGRLACTSKKELATVIDKIITYESAPADPSWFNRVMVCSGDGFIDQQDWNITWNTTGLPDGAYSIYGQSTNPQGTFGPIDRINITKDSSMPSNVTFNQDDNLNPALADGYPAPPITEICSVSNGNILGNTDYTYTPNDGEAYCNDLYWWANVSFVGGILTIRGKSYDPKPYGNLTNVHVWVTDPQGNIIFSDYRNDTEIYFEGEWAVGDHSVRGRGGALTFLPPGIANNSVFTTNGKWYTMDDVITEFSKGYGIVYFDGHGSPGWWGDHYAGIPGNRRYGQVAGLVVSQFSIWFPWVHRPALPMRKLANTDMLPVVLVGGCHNSMFSVSLVPSMLNFMVANNMFTYGTPTPSCWSWYLVKMPKTGSIATIGNTGFGWGSEGWACTIGTGDAWINGEFFHQYGTMGQHMLGLAYAQTISAYISHHKTFELEYWRHDYGWDGIDQKTVQEWILLGDPSLMIGGYS
jgi:hypothetical protein